MSADQTLAIDQGTHATRAMVFDHRGRALAMAQRPLALQLRNANEAEQSAASIRRTLREVMDEVLANPAVHRQHISAAGLATQRSSVVAWDRETGEALSPVISWQDRRAAGDIHAYAAHAPDIAARTGLRLSSHYGATKMHWLLKQNTVVQRAQARDRLLIGPLASYIAYQLLEGRPALVDDANASRSLLWNLATRDWDAELLSLFDIPASALPGCRPILHRYGRIAGHDIALSALSGDQTAALYAEGMPPDDILVANVGTGAFVMLPTGDPQTKPADLLAGISLSGAAVDRYYLEGTVNGAGSAVDWAARRFSVSEPFDRLSDWLATQRDPPVFVNTVGGLGSPWWRDAEAPRFLDRPSGAPDALAGVVESIVFLLRANIELLSGLRPSVDKIRISGGLAQLDGLCQRLADLSGLVVERSAQLEKTARGIAWLAAGLPDGWRPERPADTFSPRADRGLEMRYRRLVSALE